eukprot:6089957-Amphidinium_carterae.1
MVCASAESASTSTALSCDEAPAAPARVFSIICAVLLKFHKKARRPPIRHCGSDVLQVLFQVLFSHNEAIQNFSIN